MRIELVAVSVQNSVLADLADRERNHIWHHDLVLGTEVVRLESQIGHSAGGQLEDVHNVPVVLVAVSESPTITDGLKMTFLNPLSSTNFSASILDLS